MAFLTPLDVPYSPYVPFGTAQDVQGLPLAPPNMFRPPAAHPLLLKRLHQAQKLAKMASTPPPNALNLRNRGIGGGNGEPGAIAEGVNAASAGPSLNTMLQSFGGVFGRPGEQSSTPSPTMRFLAGL